jgi:hypothetical protein
MKNTKRILIYFKSLFKFFQKKGGGDTKIFSLKWSYDDKYLAAGK